MKKIAIGCLVVLVLGCAVAGGVAYYAYRRISATAAKFAELSKIPDIERGLKVQTSFTPPESAELTSVQVEKLVQVQSALRQRLGTRFAELETKYKVLAEKKEPTSLSDIATLMSAYGDLVQTWIDAKRAQVEALNSAELSIDEYRWIRDQAYRALGMPYVDFDVAKMAEDIKQGVTSPEPGQLRGAMGPDGPEINRKLVEPHKKHLEECMALASFGL
jgi:hypothetical protein